MEIRPLVECHRHRQCLHLVEGNLMGQLRCRALFSILEKLTSKTIPLMGGGLPC